PLALRLTRKRTGWKRLRDRIEVLEGAAAIAVREAKATALEEGVWEERRKGGVAHQSRVGVDGSPPLPCRGVAACHPEDPGGGVRRRPRTAWRTKILVRNRGSRSGKALGSQRRCGRRRPTLKGPGGGRCRRPWGGNNR